MSQRGHIVKPHGRLKSWGIIYRDPTGKQRWEGKFRTKGDAQRRLNAVLADIDRGLYARPTEETFEQFAGTWLESRRQIRGSTESGYGSIIAKQLIPRIGQYAVRDLNLTKIDLVVSGMVDDELSSKTIHNTVTLMRTMLAGRKGGSAIRRGLLHVDPTLGLELPPLESRQIAAPTPEQVWALIGAAKEIGGIGYPITYVGAFCGTRRNEALGLRFQDVLWFDNEIHIRNAISKRRGTDGAHKWEWWLGPPKSRKSVRRISGTESVMRMLADLKVGSDDSDYAFPMAGTFIDPDKFDLEVWKPITERAGLPGVRYHDLRHFFATQLIANGETAAYVRDQMGHSSIKVTFDVYGHLFPGKGAEASKRFEQAMETARKPDVRTRLEQATDSNSESGLKN